MMHVTRSACLLLALCAAAAWVPQTAAQSGFQNATVTGFLRQELPNGVVLPLNLFNPPEIAPVFVDDNNVSRLALNPEWLNVQADSNTVNVSDTEIEFGFGVQARDQQDANMSVTLDIFDNGMTFYQVTCETANDAPCNLTTPFSVVITVTSEELVGGNVTFMGGNASVNPNDTQVEFDQASGNLTFTVGPISFEEEIESGGIRQLEFQLIKEAPVEQNCTTGGCCDKETGKALAKDTVCRVSTNPCEVKEAKCDGESFECPDNEFVANGTTCKWVSPKDEMYGKYMTAKCEEPRSAGLAASSASSAMLGRKGAKGDWGMCEGMCMEGMCVLDCEGPTCCYTKKPEAKPEDLLDPAYSVYADEQNPKGPKGPKGKDDGEMMCWE